MARGKNYLEQKKYAEAIVELRTAVQADPRLAEGRLKLADAYVATGDLKNALQEVVRAADLMPNDASVQIRAASMLLLARSYQDAQTRAARALMIDPNNDEAYIISGNALAGLSDLDKALEQYEKAIEQDAANPEAYIRMAAVQVTRKQLESAEESFMRAVSVAPKSARAHLALANFHWSAKQFDKAETALKNAIAVEPGNLVANRAMGTLLMSTGRTAEAEPYFVAIAKASPTPSAQKLLAQYYATSGERKKAREVLGALAARSETFAEGTVRLAYMDVADGDRATAWQRVKEVLARQPKDGGALVLSASLLLDEGKYDEALAAVTTALGNDPSFARAHEVAGRIHAATDRREAAIRAFEETLRLDRTSFVAVAALSRLHLEDGAFDKSMSYAERARTMRPQSGETLELLTRNYLVRGDTDGARPLIGQLQKSAGNMAFVQNLVAAYHLASKKPDAARAAYEKALEADPHNIEALTGLVQSEYGRGRTAEAVRRVDSVLASGRRTEPLLLLAARTHAAAGDADRAEALFLESMKTNPHRLSAYAQLGQLYMGQNRLDDAVKQFEEIRARDPRSLPASTMLGMLHQQRGDTAAAEKEYRSALAIDSRAPVAANNLAWLYVSSNRQLDEALQLAQVAQQQMPEDPNVADTLGWIYVRKNLGALAVPHLERSAKKLPKNAPVHYHLGIAYLDAGERERAKVALERALAISSSFDGAADARRALEGLAN